MICLGSISQVGRLVALIGAYLVPACERDTWVSGTDNPCAPEAIVHCLPFFGYMEVSIARGIKNTFLALIPGYIQC